MYVNYSDCTKLCRYLLPCHNGRGGTTPVQDTEKAPVAPHRRIGASDRDSEAIRTLDPRLRRALLYPAELRNHPLDKKRITPLHLQSGRRDSNPRPSAWKANALSTELLPQNVLWAKMDSNHRSRKTADLQSAPFGHSGICPFHPDKRKHRSLGGAKIRLFFHPPNKIYHFYCADGTFCPFVAQ